MYIDYFCLDRPASALFKVVKEGGLTNAGNELNYWDPNWGDKKIICKHIKSEDGIVTIFKNEKGKIMSYPIKGKFFAGRHYKGFYEKFAIFGSDGRSEAIVLNDDYSSLIPKLIRPPQSVEEILELLICDPRYIRYIDVKFLCPILKKSPDFLKHIKTVVTSSMERILNSVMTGLSKEEEQSENKLKKRYIKEVQTSWKDLLREVKHSNLSVDVGKSL